MSFHLFLIVFSAFRLHVAYSTDGLTAHLPLLRYLATEAGLGRTNATPATPDNQPWRKPIAGNETHRGKHDSRPTGVRFATELQTGISEPRKRRPIQQLFYNIYIQDSPIIRVNKIIHAGETPKSNIGYDLRNERNNDEGDVSAPSTETTEEEPTGVLLEADGESVRKVLDAVNSELLRNRENITETPVSNKPIKFKIVNVSSRSQGRQEGETSEEAGSDVPVGNIWRAFRPNQRSEDETGNAPRQYQLRYPNGDTRAAPVNVMQIPSDIDPSDHPGLVKYKQESPDKPSSFAPDYTKQKEYPTYGRHSYHEIMRKLFEMKSVKKDMRNQSLDSDGDRSADGKDISAEEKQPQTKRERQ